MAADGGHRPAGWAPRIEDRALLRGEGRFMDDVQADSAAAGHFLRSPHAHARILSLAATAARALPGVLAVITAEDLKAAGARTITFPVPVPGRGGTTLIAPYRPALAEGRALHVGQPVALVVAETPAIAPDAAELIEIDYEPHRRADRDASHQARAALAGSTGQCRDRFRGAAAVTRTSQAVERARAGPCRGGSEISSARSPLETRGARRVTTHKGQLSARALAGPACCAISSRRAWLPPQRWLLTGDVGGAR